MSRNCEWFAGGTPNGFKIKNLDGYKKWKETLGDCLKELLHEKKEDDGIYVYIGIRWNKEPLDKLDTYINHFHPNGDGWDDGNPIDLWGGLSLFTEEPIDLLQTDEEFPFLTKVFGYTGATDGGMYRVYAKEGNVIVQELDFKVIKEYKHKKEDLISEEDLEYIDKKEQELCDKCHTKIDYKFKFEDRGYYEEINGKHGFKKLCEKCYKELKKPFMEIRRLESNIESTKKKIEELKEKNAD